jgi:hypothetical protein
LKDRYQPTAVVERACPEKLLKLRRKKSWQNRDLPSWRDRVGDLLEGKQILVKDLRDVNALYVAAKLSNAQFAVVAQGFYDRKIEFIAAGNLYYTRRKELTWLLKAAEKAGICPRSFHDQQELKPANR